MFSCGFFTSGGLTGSLVVTVLTVLDLYFFTSGRLTGEDLCYKFLHYEPMGNKILF